MLFYSIYNQGYFGLKFDQYTCKLKSIEAIIKQFRAIHTQDHAKKINCKTLRYNCEKH